MHRKLIFVNPTPLGAMGKFTVMVCWELHEMFRSAENIIFANPDVCLPSHEGWGQFTFLFCARNSMKGPDLHRKLVFITFTPWRWGPFHEKKLFLL